MSTFIIITAVILWVGLKAYKSVRKNFADPEEPSVAPHQTDYPRPAYESLFGDEKSDGMEGNPYDYEVDDVRPTFADEEKTAGYYTYESTTTEESMAPVYSETPAEPSRQTKAPQMEETVDSESCEACGQPFDLRQAVIYFSILHNQYNKEMSLS